MPCHDIPDGPLPPPEDIDETHGLKPRHQESDADRLVTVPAHDHHFCHPRLAIGSGVWDADDLATVQRAGITHVIDCRTRFDATDLYRGSGVILLRLPIPDNGRPKPAAWFHAGIDFAIAGLQDSEAKVLAHCSGGVNRGPSMGFAVLRALGLQRDAAYGAIRRVRSIARVCYRTDADAACESWMRLARRDPGRLRQLLALRTGFWASLSPAQRASLLEDER